MRVHAIINRKAGTAIDYTAEDLASEAEAAFREAAPARRKGRSAMFFYSPDRGGEHPATHLACWAGVMQADAYAGYGKLYEATRKPAPIIEAACWSHARRKFFELATLKKAPIAIEAVRRIDELFAIEREINGLSASARLAERQERSAPLVENLKTWLIEERAKLSANNPVAKAIHYSLARWPALTLFLTDGRVCLSNNAAERALRGIAVGRHNWTFAGSDRGGERAAAIYTLIETCLCRKPNYAEWIGDNSPFQRFFEASRGLRFNSIRHSQAIYSASRKASRRSLARKRVGFPRSYGLSLARAASFKARCAWR